MKNSEKIERLLETRIQALTAGIPGQRALSTMLYVLATVPLILVGVFAILRPQLVDNGHVALLAAVAGIGLSIVIWNIGGNHAERARQGQSDRERMENVQMCLLAVPEEQIKMAEFFAMLSQKEVSFGGLAGGAEMSSPPREWPKATVLSESATQPKAPVLES